MNDELKIIKANDTSKYPRTLYDVYQGRRKLNYRPMTLEEAREFVALTKKQQATAEEAVRYARSRWGRRDLAYHVQAAKNELPPRIVALGWVDDTRTRKANQTMIALMGGVLFILVLITGFVVVAF